RPDPTDAGTTRTIVDWREIQRRNLDGRRLPPDSVVLFREPSVWERHRWLMVGVAALLLLQSALIATLLVHRVQRRRVRRALAERLRFETLLSDLSAMFAAGPVTDVDQQIGIGLRRIVEDLGADRATVGTLSTSSELVLATHSWTREGVTPLRESIRGVAVPWIVSQVRRGQVVALRRLADLPPDATADRECLTRLGTRSTVVVPLV